LNDAEVYCHPIKHQCSPVSDRIMWRQNAVFRHVLRLWDDTLAHQVVLSIGQLGPNWKCQPGHPHAT